MKKIIATITSVIIALTSMAVCASADGRTGDVNDDGKISVTDISLIAAHIKGIKSLSVSKEKADVNNDGKINVTDTSLVAAHIKGIKSLKADADKKEEFTLKALVIDKNGNPVPNVSILLTDLSSFSNSGSTDEHLKFAQKTDSNGYVIFNAQGYGLYDLTIGDIDDGHSKPYNTKRININSDSIDTVYYPEAGKPNLLVQRTNLAVKVLNNEKDKKIEVGKEIEVVSFVDNKTYSATTNDEGVAVIHDFPCGTAHITTPEAHEPYTKGTVIVTENDNEHTIYDEIIDKDISVQKVVGIFYELGMEKRLGDKAKGMKIRITDGNNYDKTYILEDDFIELNLPCGAYTCAVEEFPENVDFTYSSIMDEMGHERTERLNETRFVVGMKNDSNEGKIIDCDSFALEIW